jgi:hypothetical protein
MGIEIAVSGVSTPYTTTITLPDNGASHTFPLGGSARQLFEQGVETSRTATVTVKELCPEPAKTFTVSEVRFDVSRFR